MLVVLGLAAWATGATLILLLLYAFGEHEDRARHVAGSQGHRY